MNSDSPLIFSSTEAPERLKVAGSGEAFSTLATRSTCGWFDQAVHRLQGVSNLSRNWDGYQAAPVNHMSVHFAHCLLACLRQIVGVREPKISATPSGRVAFVWETPDLEVEICPNGLFEYIGEGEELEGETPNALSIARLLTSE